jgi:tRNA-dihydrouridine synthase B
MFSWSKIKKPVFVLAPMANITTLPFRQICKKMGADIVFAPMISSNAVINNPGHALEVAEFLPIEQPVIVQLFGYNGELIGKAAKIIEKATELVKAVRGIFSGELSVKLRLGWKDFGIAEKKNFIIYHNKISFMEGLEKIGVNAISIHGRTAKQGYRGQADWDKIIEAASLVKIPVIGNGDVSDYKAAIGKSKLPNISGVMIGRGALGNPWIFKEIKLGEELLPSRTELKEIIYEQTKNYIQYAGERRAMLEMRKHLGWYLKGFPGALELRKKAMLIATFGALKELLANLD